VRALASYVWFELVFLFLESREKERVDPEDEEFEGKR